MKGSEIFLCPFSQCSQNDGRPFIETSLSMLQGTGKVLFSVCTGQSWTVPRAGLGSCEVPSQAGNPHRVRRGKAFLATANTEHDVNTFSPKA